MFKAVFSQNELVFKGFSAGLAFFACLGIMGTLTLAGASGRDSSNPPVRDDVAINAATGETFIVQMHSNPNGDLLVLQDSDAAFEEHVTLLPGADANAHFEVEMTPEGVPAYLVQSGDQWLVGKLEKSGRSWRPTRSFQTITGQGLARSLTALPDGNLALTVAAAPGAPAEVLLLAKPKTVNASSTSSEFAVVDRIPEAKLEAHATEILASESKSDSSGGMGFAAGALSGLGIAYRRHFANKWGIQVAGIAFGDSNRLMGDLGVNVMRTLSRTQRVRFYVLMGVSAFYTGSDTVTTPSWGTPGCNETDPTCTPTGSQWTNDVLLNFGAGIGIEVELTKNLGLALELPIDVMLNFGNNQPVFNGVYPIPSAALIYYF